MRILCLDTATDLASVAVVVDGAVRAERATPLHARLGDTLLGAVAEALAEAGVPRGELQLCAVGLGPGSFTGLRVGMAMAKGLHVGLGLPLVGVGTPRTLARAVLGRPSVVAIDARKDEAFIACFRPGADGEPEAVLEGAHEAPTRAGALARAAIGADVRPLVLGTGVTDALLAGLGAPFDRAEPTLDRPRAALMAAEALRRFHARGADDAGALLPDYVRGADITLPR